MPYIQTESYDDRSSIARPTHKKSDGKGHLDLP